MPGPITSTGSTLGEGTYGKVWKAKDQKIGRSVAIKEFKSTGEEGKLLCQLEISRTGRLDHPGIPTIYDVGQTEGRSYFTMKFIEGKTLQEIIAELRNEDREAHERFPFVKRTEIVKLPDSNKKLVRKKESHEYLPSAVFY